MPWRTLCGFPPTAEPVWLRIPNGAWRPDTVITDVDGNEMFVLLDQNNEMRSYEAVFGDLEGRRLVCIKRHLIKEFWKDGYYFCTYRPNYPGQMPLAERDVDHKKVYPFSYLAVSSIKGRFYYHHFDQHQQLKPPRLWGENPWMGFMMVCCTPVIRCGKWRLFFKKGRNKTVNVLVDQWRNLVEVGPHNDLLAALCMAYVFDRCQCQPLVTVFGRDPEDEYIRPDDDASIDSHEQEERQRQQRQQSRRSQTHGGEEEAGGDHDDEQEQLVELENLPESQLDRAQREEQRQRRRRPFWRRDRRPRRGEEPVEKEGRPMDDVAVASSGLDDDGNVVEDHLDDDHDHGMKDRHSHYPRDHNNDQDQQVDDSPYFESEGEHHYYDTPTTTSADRPEYLDEDGQGGGGAYYGAERGRPNEQPSPADPFAIDDEEDHHDPSPSSSTRPELV